MNAESLVEEEFGFIRDIMEQNAQNPLPDPALSKNIDACSGNQNNKARYLRTIPFVSHPRGSYAYRQFAEMGGVLERRGRRQYRRVRRW